MFWGNHAHVYDESTVLRSLGQGKTQTSGKSGVFGQVPEDSSGAQEWSEWKDYSWPELPGNYICEEPLDSFRDGLHSSGIVPVA